MSPLPDPTTAAGDPRALAELNRWLAGRSAEQRITWALQSLSGEHALSTSFGAQSAVALHLSTRIRPDLPVILIDTGYLFPETYRFADQLVEQLPLPHLQEEGALVRPGQHVQAGQQIGLSGNTGFTTGPHSAAASQIPHHAQTSPK